MTRGTGPRSGIVALLLVAVVLASAVLVRAQTGRPTAADASPVSETPQPAEHDDVRVSFDGRPMFDVGQVFHLELGGRLDADIAGGLDGDDDDFDWSGRRLEIAGSVMRRARFELSREFGSNQPWRDVFVEVDATPAFGVRVGRFKVPFSDDRLRGLGKLDFVNRSFAARVLAWGRDDGVTAFGELGRKRVTYEVGAFRGALHEAGREDIIVRAEDPRPLGAGRVTLRPFVTRKDKGLSFRSLRVGASLFRGWNNSGFSTLDVRTIDGHEPLLDSYLVRGPRRGLGLEAQWSPGPVLLSAEWMDVHESRRGQAVDGGDLPDLIGHGWYTSAVWKAARLRGRDHSWLRQSLFRELEIVGRLESISLGTGGADAMAILHPRAERVPWQVLRALTLGGSWRLNRYGRIQMNAIAERPRATWWDVGDNGTRWSAVTRLQLQF